MRKEQKFLTDKYTPRNPKKYTGKYPITYRSSWEKRLMVFFDCNEAVLQWSSESITIRYFDPTTNEIRRYIPDFMVVYRRADGTVVKEILEVKPLNQSIKPEQGKREPFDKYMKRASLYIKNFKKWEAVQHVATQNGFSFRVLTEHEIFGK